MWRNPSYRTVLNGEFYLKCSRLSLQALYEWCFILPMNWNCPLFARAKSKHSRLRGRVNIQQIMQSANSTPLSLGWLTLAHLQQCAPSVLGARISRHCWRSLAQPSSNRTGEQLPLGAQPFTSAKCRYPMKVRLQKREPANAARSHNSQPFPIELTESALIKVSINKASLATGPFLLMGDRDVAGGIK